MGWGGAGRGATPEGGVERGWAGSYPSHPLFSAIIQITNHCSLDLRVFGDGTGTKTILF